MRRSLHHESRVTSAALLLGMLAAHGQGAQDPSADGAAPTFAREVAPILYGRCAPCHRAGETAPFPLLSYDDAREHAKQIARVTGTRRMPPWLPDPVGPDFVGDRRLSDAEIATLERWAQAGAPRGDAAQEPAPPDFPGGWRLGECDLVVTMPEPYTLRADGRDTYRNFVLPAPVDRLRYVRAIEIRPGNRRVVHHAVLKLDRTDTSRRLDLRDAEPGFDEMDSGAAVSPDGQFLGWTPGRTPTSLPEGMSWRLPPGADLVLQLHLVPSGKPEPVQASVGIWFTDTPPQRLPFLIHLASRALDIPAGESAYEVRDEFTLPVDVELHALAPHAHFLGKSVEAWAELPDGTRRALLSIPRWDFSWQDEFRLATPLPLKQGTKLAMRWLFDNSDGNPRNPRHPPERVRFGPGSWQEMCDLWVQVLPTGGDDFNRLAQVFMVKELATLRAGFEAALAADPKDASAHLDLGLTLLQQRDADGAVRELRVALALAPDLARAWSSLGNILLERREVAEAKRCFEKTLEFEADHAAAMNGLGSVAESENDLAGAEAWFGRAVAAQSGFYAARVNLGRLLERRGAEVLALEQFSMAIELAPDPDAASLLEREVASLLATAADPAARDGKRAIELVKRLIANAREDVALLDLLAAAQAETGRYKAAVETAQRALALARANGDAVLAERLEQRLALYRAGKPFHAGAAR